MHSKSATSRASQRFTPFLFVGALVSLTGCGNFGLNPKADSTLQFKMGGAGCLNGLGRQLEQFADGTVSEKEWKKSWNCASESFEQFRTYARGSAEEGFTTSDLKMLAEGFLITDQAVPDELISGALRLKSAVLGGNALTLTYEELDQVIDLMAWARDASARLIPLMHARSSRPDARTLSDLARELKLIADELASKVGHGPSFLLKWSELKSLAEQSADLLKLDLPLDTLFAALELGKGLLLSGSRDGLESGKISEAIRMLAPAGAAALEILSAQPSLMTGPNEAAEFYLGIAESLRPLITRALDIHGGSISLEWADRALDLVPDSITTTGHGHIMDRAVLRAALRNLNWRFFRSQSRADLDSGGLDQIYSLFREWTRGQTLIETIFENVGNADEDGVTRTTFLEGAERLRPGLGGEDQVHLSRIVDLVNRYPALFLRDESEFFYAPIEKYSLSAVSKLHAFNLVGRELLRGYSVTEEKNLATIKDLEILVAEWIPMLSEMQKIDPTVPLLHERRFREGNLFTGVSNGDIYMDLDEITLYLQQIGSIGETTTRVMTEVNEICGTDSYDVYGSRWMKPRCFRESFFGNYRKFWDHMPTLVSFYSSLDARQRRKFEVALEQGGRRYGYTDELIGEYDVQGYVGVSQYVESIFSRFDTDQSTVIQLDELMGAFPVFKRELAEFGKIDPSQTALLEGAFTYTVRYGVAPTTDFMGTSHFLGWLASKPFWTIHGDRTALYKVLAALNPVEKIPPSDQADGDFEMIGAE